MNPELWKQTTPRERNIMYFGQFHILQGNLFHTDPALNLPRGQLFFSKLPLTYSLFSFYRWLKCVRRVTKMGRGTQLRLLPACLLSIHYSLNVCMTHIYGNLCGHHATGGDNTVERSGIQLAKDFFLFLWPALTGLRDHSHWTHHTCWFSSWRMISPTHRPVPVDTHHSQETKSMPAAGFEPTFPTNERLKTHALDLAAIGTGWRRIYSTKKCIPLFTRC